DHDTDEISVGTAGADDPPSPGAAGQADDPPSPGQPADAPTRQGGPPRRPSIRDQARRVPGKGFG
ncbi:MAG TPA: hypothetical protein VGR21_12395, partial [Cryptosporangiaceae bacterium]|nr:hypothetical protein [Cryptosporangiaceae bacterium]